MRTGAEGVFSAETGPVNMIVQQKTCMPENGICRIVFVFFSEDAFRVLYFMTAEAD